MLFLPSVLVMFMVECVISFQAPRAEMTWKDSGVCGNEMIDGLGLNSKLYKPAIVFDPNSVEIYPPRVVVPGCITMKARNVNIRRPIRELSAEYLMQIGTHPDPSRGPDMGCGKRPDGELCGCEHMNNTCLFCDFCKRMKAQVKNYTIQNQNNLYQRINLRKYGDQCECDEIVPGVYDLEAQVCTPENSNDIYSAVSEDIKERLGNGKAMSMFTTILMYDVPFRNMKRYAVDPTKSSAFNEYFFQRQVKQFKTFGLVGCYLMASDITLI